MNAGRACLFNRQRALFINGNAVNSCFSQSFRHDAALFSQDIAYGPLFSSVSGAGTLNDMTVALLLGSVIIKHLRGIATWIPRPLLMAAACFFRHLHDTSLPISQPLVRRRGCPSPLQPNRAAPPLSTASISARSMGALLKRAGSSLRSKN